MWALLVSPGSSYSRAQTGTQPSQTNTPCCTRDAMAEACHNQQHLPQQPATAALTTAVSAPCWGPPKPHTALPQLAAYPARRDGTCHTRPCQCHCTSGQDARASYRAWPVTVAGAPSPHKPDTHLRALAACTGVAAQPLPWLLPASASLPRCGRGAATSSRKGEKKVGMSHLMV
jgi:hypothetical protein